MKLAGAQLENDTINYINYSSTLPTPCEYTKVTENVLKTVKLNSIISTVFPIYKIRDLKHKGKFQICEETEPFGLENVVMF